MISNLKPLNELGCSRLENAISPYKIERAYHETPADVITCDLAAINEFLFYLQAEPLINPENAKIHNVWPLKGKLNIRIWDLYGDPI